jgi:hypothetical protein
MTAPLSSFEKTLARELEVLPRKGEDITKFRERLAQQVLINRQDPLLATEVKTGQPYTENPGLGLAAIHVNNELARERAEANCDIHYTITWKRFQSVLGEHGFERHAKDTYALGDEQEECGLWLNPKKAIVIFADSYWGKLNGGKAYFELNLPNPEPKSLEYKLMMDAKRSLAGTIQGIFLGEKREQRLAEEAAVDVRYAPLTQIQTLERAGWKFNAPWKYSAEHWVWLQNSSISYLSRDGKPQEGADVRPLPAAVAQAMGLQQ